MIDSTIIPKQENDNIAVLNEEAIYKTYRMLGDSIDYSKHPITAFRPKEIWELLGLFMQEQVHTANTPTLVRVRDNDTMTQRIIVGNITNFDYNEFATNFKARAVKKALNPVVKEDRISAYPGIDILFNKNQLIILHTTEVPGIFSNVVTDKDMFNEIKASMWKFASKCAYDIHNTCVAFEIDGSINIEVKASNYDKYKLMNIGSSVGSIVDVDGYKIKIFPHRLVYSVK